MTMKQAKNNKESSKSSSSVLDFSPKGYFIEYPFLVDACIARFISDFQDDFKQMKDGRFKLKKSISQPALKELLSAYLDETISSVLSKAHQGLPPSPNDWIIVADSGSDRRVSYEMVEKDIDIGLKRIVAIFDSLFNRSMEKTHRSTRTIYCKHRLLLSSDWEKICKKKIFGSSCVAVLCPRARKAISETASDEKTKLLTKAERKLVLEEAAGWILSNMRRGG